MRRLKPNKAARLARKRRGWKKEFLESLNEVAKNIGKVSKKEILRTVRTHRRERRAPKITLTAKG